MQLLPNDADADFNKFYDVWDIKSYMRRFSMEFHYPGQSIDQVQPVSNIFDVDGSTFGKHRQTTYVPHTGNRSETAPDLYVGPVHSES